VNQSIRIAEFAFNDARLIFIDKFNDLYRRIRISPVAILKPWPSQRILRSKLPLRNQLA
jgi:hypothetical protein